MALNYPTNPIAALSKHEDEQYVDGMSPPSSANESETLPSISLSTNPVTFQSKFSAVISDYEEHDDEEDHDFMEEDELEEEMPSRRSDIVSAFFSLFILQFPRTSAASIQRLGGVQTNDGMLLLSQR